MVHARRALVLAALCAPVLAQQRALFDAPLVVADEYKRIVKTLDLNGDGWMDAFGWWTDSQYGANPGLGEMHGWINDGTGRLVLAWNDSFFSGTANPEAVDSCEVGDLDGDGDDDMVLVANQRIRVYLSQGAQSPVLAINQVHGQALALALADFDLDGTLDLAVADAAGLSIYAIQLGQGALQSSSYTTTSFVADGRLVAAELTGDTTPDLLLSGTRVFPVVAGQIQPHSVHLSLPFGYSSEESRRHNAADLDGDGDIDFMTFTVNSYTGVARYRIARRTGPGTFVGEPVQSGGPARRLFDVDGDGDLDGVCCGGGGGSPGRSVNTVASSFRIALNDGTGAFAAAISLPSVGSQAIAGAEDLDHDGDLDLVAGRCVYYAQGPLTSHPSPVVGTRPQDERTVVDLDADGDLDFEPTRTSVCRNRGDGGVAVVPLTLTPGVPGTQWGGDPIAGDWDGDGDQDLLLRLTGGAGLELLRNVGCGSFVSAGQCASATGMAYFAALAEDALAADVDADGDLDLVLRTRTDTYTEGNKSGWWRNDGTGGLTWQETFSGQCVSHVVDLNNDAIPDLLAMSDYSGFQTYPLSWCPGLGAGAFGAWQAIPDTDLRYWLDQVDVADLDGDGDNDIAAPFWGAYANPSLPGLLRPHVYWNDGVGNFARAQIDTLLLRWGHDTPLTAAAGDLDGDGLTDLVFAPLTLAPGGGLIVLRRPDNSGWMPGIVQTMFDADSSQTRTSHFTLRDPDGDGDLDLLSDRFVRNTREQGAEGGVRLQVHNGIAGQGGVIPLFGARGPFRVGESAQLRLRGLRPGATGRVIVSYPDDPPAAGMGGGVVAATRFRIHAEILFTASGVSGDAAGSGSWSLNYTVPGYAGGRTKCYAAFVDDSDAPLGRSRSNELYITYGP